MLVRLFGSLLASGALAALAGAAAAQPLTKLVFGTNWYAQAEHGGFYQAVAEGLYRKHGLDVEVRMGGPQVNGLQLLLAGQFDLFMGYDLQTLLVVEQGLPVVTVAATFQKDPAVIIAHPGVTKLEELKGRPIAISSASATTFWPWLRTRYGFDDSQKRPYAFSVQPFLVDQRLSQQGYATSEPYSIEKGGVKPVVFLLADLGYPPYAQTIVVTRDTLAKRRDAVRRFVQASAEGWKSYLANPAPGNALIQRDNPQMEDDLIAFGVRKMKEYRIVTGGDAAKLGIMTMTDARWKRTADFMTEAKTVKPGLDYRRAYTLDIVREVEVLP
jgi:NitT/TauT family transport system substrate-binding protein